MSEPVSFDLWPVCMTPRSKTDPTPCNTAYAFRRGLSWTKGWMWVWSPDCKHKGAKAVTEFHDEHGKLEPNEDGSFTPRAAAGQEKPT